MIKKYCGGRNMTHGGMEKIIGAGVLFILVASTVGSIGIAVPKNTPQPLGILEYDPKSHDFGNMSEGEINSTTFDIWTSGGCCELIFNLTWNCSWVSVFPTTGVSNGEHVPITVTVDTTGLSIESYACDILITTNGGGDGIFNVTLVIITATIPKLAFYPQSYNFGIIPQGFMTGTTFDIWNSGLDILDYSLSEAKNWIDVSPIQGNSTGEHDTITVSINTNGLVNGSTYQCGIEIISNGGNEVFSVYVKIGTIPKIELETISGGLFKIKTVIKNTGTADATGITWKISLSGNGLILLGKETTGTVSALAVGAKETISSDLIFGFGSVKIHVLILNAETAAPAYQTVSAKLFLFSVKI
jgi:hypothetical protein